MTAIQKFSPTVIELGAADSVVITRQGKVVGFVEVKRERNGNVELLANPVCYYDWATDRDNHVLNSFATTLATEVDSADDLASASNFINFMNRVKA
jgi:alkylhydroperoxidase family enzyme